MKRKVTCLVISSLFAVSAMAAGTTTSTNMSPSTSATMSSGASTSMTSSNTPMTAVEKRDAGIMDVLMVVNTNEINYAQVALKRSSNPSVKNFAQTMVNDHTACVTALQNLSQKLNITPMVTSKATSLQKAGEKGVNALNSISSSKFDATYIDKVVTGNQAVLNLIDNKLLPKVSNPNLKTLLTNTRAKVQQHLQMAQTVQKQLAK